MKMGRYIVRRLLVSLLAMAVVSVFLACVRQDEPEVLGSEGPQPHEPYAYHVDGEIIYVLDWAPLLIWAKLGETHPHLATEVTFTVRNMSLEEAVKALETKVGGSIPYRLKGSGFQRIKYLSLPKMKAVDILGFLAQASGAYLDFEEGRIVFVKE